jgi:hypothetical protein
MIKIYHHIYPTKNGLQIASEQKDRLYKKITEEFEYIPNVVEKRQTELWTLKIIQDDCKNFDDKTPILYIHTKGATKPTIEREQWREYMELELIDNYKFHLDILTKGFSSSGVLMGIPYWSSSIYGGNFWWTTAGYIKSLPNDLGWDKWTSNITYVPNENEFSNWIRWAENKFINQGPNFNPYSVPIFNFEGFEEFALLIRKEIGENKNMYKNNLIKTIL